MKALLLALAALTQEPDITLSIVDVVNVRGPVVWVDPAFDVPIAHNLHVHTERTDGLECQSSGVLVRPGVRGTDRALVRATEGSVQWRPLSCYTGQWLVRDEELEVVEGVSVEELVPEKVSLIHLYTGGQDWFPCKVVEARKGYRKYACTVHRGQP